MIKYAVVDRRMEEDMRSKLEAEAYTIVESYDHKNLYDAIRSVSYTHLTLPTTERV